MSFKTRILFLLFAFCFLLFAIYSYAFLDIGLTLTSWQPYLNLQKQMQHFGYFNRSLSTIIFIALVLLLFTVYSLLITHLRQVTAKFNSSLLYFILLICAILVFSYPAFSHDIFNYIFNAKMVLVYHADPHRMAAWNFPDPMLGFMRNIHTVAPYFYGWTIISLLPYLMGIGRIFTEIISFKFFSAILFLLTAIVLNKTIKQLKLKQGYERLLLFILNPLILIEAIANGHNDFAMMLPALICVYFLNKYNEVKLKKFLLFAFCFLLFSISTKYATVILAPLFIIKSFKKDFDIGLWGAIALFLVPFTRPLGQLHSWYFIWPLTWGSLAKNIKWLYFTCFVSFFALLRYAPYIWYGNWDPPVMWHRFVIYFAIPILVLPVIIKKKF